MGIPVHSEAVLLIKSASMGIMIFGDDSSNFTWEQK